MHKFVIGDRVVTDYNAYYGDHKKRHIKGTVVGIRNGNELLLRFDIDGTNTTPGWPASTNPYVLADMGVKPLDNQPRYWHVSPQQLKKLTVIELPGKYGVLRAVVEGVVT